MSTLKADTIVAADGTSPVTLTKQSAAKAWAKVSADITSILGSFSVSSLDDDGTGDGAVNLTNAMSDANYSVVGSVVSGSGTSSVTVDYDGTQSASSFEFEVTHLNSTFNRTHLDRVSFHAAHGDLA